EKCRDTGYTDDIPARFCECFQKALRLRMFEDGTMAGLDRQNFTHFSDELVKACNTPQEAERLLAAKAFCQQYAQEYPRVERPNLLLYGPGGVGKTFLLNCVFARLLERGFSGVRITAYRMHETMRLKHIGAQEEAQGFEELIQTPILVIDDLGTEPMLRNITVEYLFTLLNERCAAGRATLIATNLSPAELKERYGERVASRLLDRSRCVTVRMAGADLRQGKLRNGGEEA
ncbi:MAG: ATP-binding protein, partial [Eubacteriales bacterium]|nr:ATP-binding protein [Eubacteriales bacterium]